MGHRPRGRLARGPGVIKRPSGWARAWSTWWTWFVDHSLVAGIFGGPIMLWGLLFSRWWRVGREPRMGPIVVQYEPPAGLGPGEAGTLIDNKPDNRDLIAGLVREFLSRVETHRLASMPLTPELFERHLPYAIALGVERRWARSFEDICAVPPQWYSGSQPIDSFDLSTFSHSLGQMSSCTAAAMTSSPDSSDGSGFSGGGDGGGGGSGF